MPDGWTISLAGGVLIGLASGGLYFLAGEIAGITGILRRAVGGPARGWRIAFIGGMALAALVWLLTGNVAQAIEGLNDIPVWTLVGAGLLVGIGTDLGNGCTSGHGVCGLSRFSLRSLVSVLIFMAVAMLTVWIIRHGGLA
ncbi:MAG: YeeE/YedE family protein [Novosphingobium meiothermophilum]|uniref:YeeE/YedE family protein n=1 Tax=Novosphingobium TaxID=165696 RepID=UPI000D6E0FC3|nr:MULTISPECIES: YeeE/YedE family protein [Novosphingobium]